MHASPIIYARESGGTAEAPTVSVVMNCFNGAEYLLDALESVRSQSFEDWEIVFWDNQSTDRSSEIFHSFKDSRFRYYRAGTHTGLGDARNQAVIKCTGPWLAFLDCDDTWDRDKLEQQLRHSEGGVGLVYGPYRLKIDAREEQRSALEEYYRRQRVRPHRAMHIYEALLERNFIILSTLLLRRQLYWEVGGINGNLTQNEDYELLLKVARLTKAVCIDSICASYRIHGRNNSHVQVELNFKENLEIFSSLPQDKAVARALRINASRYAFYKISRGDVWGGLGMLVRQGSPGWALRRAYSRLSAYVNRTKAP